MARKYTCSFEKNSVTPGVEFSGVQGTISIATTNVRSGSYSLRAQGGGSNSAEQDFNGSLADGPFYSRVHLYIATLPSSRTGVFFFGNNSGNQRCAIALETDGTLKLFRSNAQIGSASAALDTNRYYAIDMLFQNISDNASVLVARLEETVFATTNSSTTEGGVRYCRVGNVGAATTVDLYFDDWAVNDSATTSNNSWIDRNLGSGRASSSARATAVSRSTGSSRSEV